MNYGRLEARLAAAMREARVPGLALAIVAGHEVAYARGFGVTSVEAGGVQVTPDTLFQVGSVTKPLTGTMILTLVEQGFVDLDAPLTSYLPRLVLRQPGAVERMTVRQLLSHTAGLPWDQITPTRLFGRRDPAGLAAYVEHELPSRPLVAPPGTLYNYSNPGVNLAARVAEVVTGLAYAELVERQLFEPLGMRHSTFDPTVAMTHAVAQSHDLTPDGRLNVRRPAPDNSAQYPSAFAYSTVLDLARFASMHLSGGSASRGRFLTPGSVALMRAPHADRYEGLATSYGLTFYLDRCHGVALAGHPGGINTLGSQFVMAPERGAAVVMLYNRAQVFDRVAGELVTEILVELLDLGRAEPVIAPTVDATLWSHYTGTYVRDGGGSLRIGGAGSGLTLERDGATTPLTALRDDLFAAGDRARGRDLVVGFPPLPLPGAYLRCGGQLYRRDGSEAASRASVKPR